MEEMIQQYRRDKDAVLLKEGLEQLARSEGKDVDDASLLEQLQHQLKATGATTPVLPPRDITDIDWDVIGTPSSTSFLSQ